jgi:hypothetical protein
MCKCQDCNCNGGGFSNFYDEFTGGRYANAVGDATTQQAPVTATTDTTSNVNVADVLQSFLAGLSGQGVPSQGNQMSDAILNALKSQISVINSNGSLTQPQKDQQIIDLVSSAIDSVNSNPVLSQDQKNILVSQIQNLTPTSNKGGSGSAFWQNNKYFILGGIVIALGVTGFLIYKGKMGKGA